MDVNYIKMHNPTNAAPEFSGKSHRGDYSDSLMELNADIGRVMTALRNEAPNTIVILTADNGARLDAYPDAGTTPILTPAPRHSEVKRVPRSRAAGVFRVSCDGRAYPCGRAL
jgi:arylsulfatase A-like enzyme